MTQALLLVDFQNDYFPGGAMELVGSPEAEIQAGILLQAFRRARRPTPDHEERDCDPARPGVHDVSLSFRPDGLVSYGVRAHRTPKMKARSSGPRALRYDASSFAGSLAKPPPRATR